MSRTYVIRAVHASRSEVLAFPPSLARQVPGPVPVPVLSLVLVSLFQSRRWLGREQSGVPPCVPCSRPRLLRPPWVRPLVF
eukprot:2799557-Prymnesium_polylepis.1